MKVIPVIDILNGNVVHAVRGERKEYNPIQSILTKSVEPLEVAKVFKTLGFSELYIADLDAITKGKWNFEVIKRIANETELKVTVDAGVADLETAKKLLECGITKVIIGTETLQNKGFVGDVVSVLGRTKVIVSLDLKYNKLLFKLGFDGCKDPLYLLREFKQMGVLNTIILDLARVGSDEGVNVDFVTKGTRRKRGECLCWWRSM